jgi:hypothetical protein
MSFAASEFDQPYAAISSTNPSRSALTSRSSNAASTMACIRDSNSSFGAVHVVDEPASREAFSA